MRDRDLDDLLAGARGAAPEASPALLARVMQDALAEQPRPPTRQAVRPASRAIPLHLRLLAALGGGGALAGLATATLAGVWIGFAGPAPLADVTDLVLTGSGWSGVEEEGLDTVDLFLDVDLFAGEG